MIFSIVETKYDNLVFYGISCQNEKETLCFKELTTDKAEIETLKNNLQNGAVTKTTLEDIIDDFINK